MDYQIKHAALLKDVVDMHLHVAPSLMNRVMDIAEIALRADEFGYKAVVHKDHHHMTAASATLLNKHVLAGKKVKVLGAIALNNAVGGLRRETVQAAVGFGVKAIWLPTVSAKNHIDFVAKTGHFPKLAHGITLDETPIHLVDESGKCRKEIVEIFRLLAEHPGILVGAGHGDHHEINTVVEKAAEMGFAERLVIDHPTFMLGASMDEVRHWVKLGCTIEHIAACTTQYAGAHHRHVPLEEVLEMIRIAGARQTIISSDFGQADNRDPVAGFDCFFDELLQNGISEKDIVTMSSVNPSRLMGLD